MSLLANTHLCRAGEDLSETRNILVRPTQNIRFNEHFASIHPNFLSSYLFHSQKVIELTTESEKALMHYTQRRRRHFVIGDGGKFASGKYFDRENRKIENLTGVYRRSI